jgi:hypothetical protein
LRYSEWWLTEFPQEFRKRGFEVITLGNDFLFKHNMKKAMLNFNSNKYSLKEALINIGKPYYEQFAPVDLSIEFETEQIKEYMKLEVTDCDILFHADLSFPGLFHHVLFHQRPKRCFCFCHATSRNYLDYFSKDMHIKFPIEKKVAELYDTVFVGSDYHRNKIGFKNSYVVGVPLPPYNFFREKKEINIISVARYTEQKIDSSLEHKIEKEFGLIFRKQFSTWDEYYCTLSKSKILLITSKEDTFNYSVLEALENNTIVLAPNRCVFPEILSKEYLYNDFDDLKKKIKKILNSKTYHAPRIENKLLVKNFFNKISKIMVEIK